MSRWRTRTHRPLQQNIVDIVGGASAELLSSPSAVELSYCGFNDLCSDMAEHGNGIITCSTLCGGVSA